MAESMMLRAKEKALAPRAFFPIEWCLGPRAWQQYPLLRFDPCRLGTASRVLQTPKLPCGGDAQHERMEEDVGLAFGSPINDHDCHTLTRIP